MDILKTIEQIKIVPVVVLQDKKDAKPLGEALIGGGLPVSEVTFRTEAARDSIEIMACQFPDMLVGAGSLTSKDQAKQAVDAGAKFLVSAGFNRGVAEYSAENQIPYFPGICTPSELMLLLEYDLPVAKFFPAEQSGGLKTINAIGAAFPKMKFMPTGGINTKNVCEYLKSPRVIACGGSWMVKGDLVQSGNFEEIERLTKEAIQLVREV